MCTRYKNQGTKTQDRLGITPATTPVPCGLSDPWVLSSHYNIITGYTPEQFCDCVLHSCDTSKSSIARCKIYKQTALS